MDSVACFFFLLVFGEQYFTHDISVDVPSGWDVDKGDVLGTGFLPGKRNVNIITL
jgi:hypothetical protein